MWWKGLGGGSSMKEEGLGGLLCGQVWSLPMAVFSEQKETAGIAPGSQLPPTHLGPCEMEGPQNPKPTSLQTSLFLGRELLRTEPCSASPASGLGQGGGKGAISRAPSREAGLREVGPPRVTPHTRTAPAQKPGNPGLTTSTGLTWELVLAPRRAGKWGRRK